MTFKTQTEWIAANPVKKHLVESGETVVDLATRIGRSPATVHLWLRGAVVPTGTWHKLRVATGNLFIEEEWKEWADAHPGKIQ